MTKDEVFAKLENIDFKGNNPKEYIWNLAWNRNLLEKTGQHRQAIYLNGIISGYLMALNHTGYISDAEVATLINYILYDAKEDL